MHGGSRKSPDQNRAYSESGNQILISFYHLAGRVKQVSGTLTKTRCVESIRWRKTKMPKYGLLIEYEFCVGCRACELACKQEHNRPDDEYGISIPTDFVDRDNVSVAESGSRAGLAHHFLD